VPAGTPVTQIAQTLRRHQVSAVPVLDEADGVVGLVSLMATEWACQICGEPVRGEHQPDQCPKCLGGAERFILQEQPPGA
jgi:rubrerythrin